MQIDNIFLTASCEQILLELQAQMRINNLPYLHKIKSSGRSIQVCCPYHKHGEEKKPSAGIRASDGMFHCFTCNEIHTLPEVISYCFGHNDMGLFGRTWLMKNFATIAKEERPDITIDMNRHEKGTRTHENRFISEEELDSYRYYHPYWKQRRIEDNSLIELFDLGYDRKTQCITFPVRDIEGNCLFVARRSVKYKFFNYPEGVSKPLYGLYELEQVGYPKELIVCESMLDALTCWQYKSYAVALNGLGNDLQFTQLRKLPCRKLILATDNDEAGIKARNRIKKYVGNSKIITQFVIPKIKRPDGKVTKDINDLTFDEFKNLRQIF